VAHRAPRIISGQLFQSSSSSFSRTGGSQKNELTPFPHAESRHDAKKILAQSQAGIPQ
jgi:hypothetical protein